MVDKSRELDASGVRLWGLTNFTTKYVRAAHELFPELNLLRDTVVSSEEGILKPDPGHVGDEDRWTWKDAPKTGTPC